ncbi:MAG: GNAT family N-acetyltransferase [Salinarimonas sp.]|nr:GNAT family N-acetyltransferase [Salinarimonas sp.]
MITRQEASVRTGEDHAAIVVDDAPYDAMPSALQSAWEELADAPIHPNPFYAHAALDALLAADPVARTRLRLLCLRLAGGPKPGRLVGLLPYLSRGERIGWRRSTANYTSPYLPCGTPLIARDAPAGWADTLVDALIAHGRPVILKHVPVSGPLGEALLAAIRAQNLPWQPLDPFERPVATPAESYDAFIRRAYGRNRRKSLKRLRNALGAEGTLTVASGTDPQDCAAAVETFLALEAGGWKGEHGTALAQRRATTTMLEQLFAAANQSGRRRVDRLLLDGRTIAISMSLVQDGTAFLWKTAYDESLRRYAPGIVLEDAIVQALHAEPDLNGLDSCTLTASPLQDLYDERLAISDIVMASGRGATTLLDIEQSMRKLRRRAADWLQRNRD